MKRMLILIIVLILLPITVHAAGPRFQLAYTGLYTAGPETQSTVFSFRTGLSQCVWTMDHGGALYTVALGEYGDNKVIKAKGAGVEFVYFPVAPNGKGLRIFGIAGTNVTEIENYEEFSKLTFLQGAAGAGLYWAFNSEVALWAAVKAQMSEDWSFVNFGIGLSIVTW